MATDTTTTDTPVLATPPSPDPLSTPPDTPPSPAPLSPATPPGPWSPATLPGPSSPPDTEDTASTDSASTRHILASRYQQARSSTEILIIFQFNSFPIKIFEK